MEEQQFKLVVGVTPSGKTLQIVRNTSTNMFMLQYTTGGEVPEDLRGPWNNLDMLKSRSDVYLNSLVVSADKKKEKKYAKSGSNKAV